MLRAFACVFLLLTSAPSIAATLDPAAINDAAAPARTSAKTARSKLSPSIVKLEILLDRARFSPGEIDGRFGENAQKALAAFAEANGLTFDKTVTPELWNKLASTSGDAAIVDYKITDADVKGPFLKKVPAKMEDMKDLEALSYTSPREGLAEKFHMSQALLTALNPGKTFDRAGETISVANVLAGGKPAPIARLEVDKTKQVLKAFDASGALVAFYPATVGSSEKPTPSGTLKVTSTDEKPTYRYNPDYKFKGVKSHKPFTIRPGPNNPVGSYWIGLSAQGYGIHGTAEPDKVGKSASHGCVRLTNWDAHALGETVKRGTPVVFLDRPSEAAAPAQNRPSTARRSQG